MESSELQPACRQEQRPERRRACQPVYPPAEPRQECQPARRQSEPPGRPCSWRVRLPGFRGSGRPCWTLAAGIEPGTLRQPGPVRGQKKVVSASCVSSPQVGFTDGAAGTAQASFSVFRPPRSSPTGLPATVTLLAIRPLAGIDPASHSIVRPGSLKLKRPGGGFAAGT